MENVVDFVLMSLLLTVRTPSKFIQIHHTYEIDLILSMFF